VSDPNALACRDVVELLSDYLDGALDDGSREAVEAHLAACEGCGRALAQLRETVRVTGMLREEQLTEQQKATLLEAFRGFDRGAD
jgi:anti-sigma factor RsiW